MTPELHAALLFCLRSIFFSTVVGINIGLSLVLWSIKHYGVCA